MNSSQGQMAFDSSVRLPSACRALQTPEFSSDFRILQSLQTFVIFG